LETSLPAGALDEDLDRRADLFTHPLE
jgi:hypothetical protein